MSATLQQRTLNPAVFNRSLITAIHDTWFATLPNHATAPIPSLYAKWFGVNQTPESKAAFDEQCRSQFLPALSSLSPKNHPLPPFTSYVEDRALAPELSSPFRALPMLKTTNEDEKMEVVLALVLLLDQMPRNIFRREEAKVVYEHYDRLSRSIIYCIFHQYNSKELSTTQGNGLADLYNLHHAQYVAAYPVKISWLLLPLMHSEDLDDHDLYTKLAKETKRNAEDRGDKDGTTWAESSINFEDKHRKIMEKFGRYPHRSAVLGRKMTKEEEDWLEGGGDTFGAG